MPRLCFLIFSLVFLASISASAQTTRKVLFLGNSYTGVNNLPQLVKDLAFSAGDTLLFDRNTPGGNTLENHSQNPVSISKIAAGSWDYVILQEQSQRPITNTSKFTQGANRLYDSIKKYNPCATPLLYMTWGRKNGDVNNCPSFPVMCTYQGMDSALRKNYLDLTDNLDAEVSPVSIVWRNLRQNNPNIELYQPDGSHPSAAGSYAAACSFYTAIFKKNPALITFDYSLNATDASIIRNAAKAEVFDSLAKWDYKKTARSGFRYNRVTGVNQLQFSPTSHIVSQSYFWDFGDGFSSTMRNPSHSFATNGSYTVSLTTNTCDWQGLLASTSDTIIQFCSHTPTITSSNPWLCNYDTLWTEPANSYQWYANGQVIPETGRFLANYQAYNSMSFSVASSLNGCSELSEVFAANPPWSGYFFDAAWGGDPCEGDTALFIAKHFNGSLPDSGLVLWYKNGLLLPAATNQDTLLITSQGIYQCRAVDTTTNCPFDTTISTTVVFDCGSLSTEKTRVKESWSLYPNPATESVMLELPADLARSEIRIYNAKGRLVKNLKAAPTQSIDISALPKGLYFIRLQNQDVRVLKFVKE